MTSYVLTRAVPDSIQVAESGGLSDLAKQGVLGTICVLFIVAIVWLTRNWKGTMEARIADAKGYADALKGVNEATAELTVETNRSSDALKATIENLRTEMGARKEQIQTLSTNIDGLKTEQIKFIAAAQAMSEGGRNGR